MTPEQSKRLPEIARFWMRVDTSGDCWTWTGELNNMGYGVFKTYAGGGRKKHLAHRYMVKLYQDIDPGMCVLHACDNPRCVKPTHLSLGTQLDNVRDALEKGRMNLTGLEIGRRVGKDVLGLAKRIRESS